MQSFNMVGVVDKGGIQKFICVIFARKGVMVLDNPNEYAKCPEHSLLSSFAVCVGSEDTFS